MMTKFQLQGSSHQDQCGTIYEGYSARKGAMLNYPLFSANGELKFWGEDEENYNGRVRC